MCRDWFIFCYCCLDNLDPALVESYKNWKCKVCNLFSPIDFKIFKESICDMCSNYCHQSTYCKNPGLRKINVCKNLFKMIKEPGNQIKIHQNLSNTVLDEACYARKHAYFIINGGSIRKQINWWEYILK